MITVNLWDATFAHDVGSVAGKPPTQIEYVRGMTSWNGTTLFVDGCARPETVRAVFSGRKVGWLHEPPCLHPQDYEGVDWDGLDMVLTYHAPLLSHPKARLVPYGGVWIPRDWWGMRDKTKLCSMLYGHKFATEGHRLRPHVANAVRNTGGVQFYGREGTPTRYGWQTKEQVLAPYAFSIVIETCRVDNLFTEILLDCFAVGTIPIFWGCPNVGEWFDDAGVLSFSTAGGALDIVERLSMDLYDELRPHAEENLRRVGRYEITDDLVAEALA